MLDHLQLVSVQQLLITVLVARWWKMTENVCLHRFRSRCFFVLLTSRDQRRFPFPVCLLRTYVLILEDLWCDTGVNTDPSPKSRWLPGATSSDWTISWYTFLNQSPLIIFKSNTSSCFNLIRKMNILTYISRSELPKITEPIIDLYFGVLAHPRGPDEAFRMRSETSPRT